MVWQSLSDFAGDAPTAVQSLLTPFKLEVEKYRILIHGGLEQAD